MRKRTRRASKIATAERGSTKSEATSARTIAMAEKIMMRYRNTLAALTR